MYLLNIYCDILIGEGRKHYNTLYPGNSSNVNLVLINLGYPSTFQISITHDNINATFSYSVDNTLVRLNQNETYEIPIVVTASVNASNRDSAKFIVTASTISATGDRSNYASFHYIASTLPPPEFIINVSFITYFNTQRISNTLCIYIFDPRTQLNCVIYICSKLLQL